MLKTIKKFLLALIALFAVFAFACGEKCEECEVCPEQQECPGKDELCDECPTCPGKDELCDECVQDYIKPTDFILYDEEIVIGSPKALIVEDFEPKGAYEGLVWSSSNEEFATVDQDGVVTGLRPGSVEITATSILDSSVSQTVEIQVLDEEIDPANIVTRELNAILAQLPVYADKSFAWPTAWNTFVEVSFKLDGQETEGFEYPADLPSNTDVQFNYQVTVTYDGTPKETTVTIWAVSDLELNAYTRVESAKEAAAAILGVYTRKEEKVAGDLLLPEYINGVKMNWSTTLRSALAADGVYNRPLDDKDVTLGITCEYGPLSSNANFPVVVKGYDADEKVEYILTEGSLAAYNGKEVNTSLVLPAYDNKFDVALTYKSGNTAIFDDAGKLVAAPAEKTEVVFTVTADYKFAGKHSFEAKTFELKVIAVPATAASIAAEEWLQASEFKAEYHFPYGSEKGNVLDVPTAYTKDEVAYEVKWDVEDVQLFSKGDEKEVAVFELNEGKPELVVQYLRYTQVQITGKFAAGEDAAEVTLLLNVGISASAANIYTGTWRNTAQKDGSLTIEQGLYDVVNNVSYFDAPLSYAGDNYGSYMWSGYSFSVEVDGKVYENFVMEYMTCYIREDAEGNLYIDKSNIYSGDGGNWGNFFVNTTNKDFKVEVGTYAADGQYFADNNPETNDKPISKAAGNRTGLTFDGYANGFVADATGKVIVGTGANKFQTGINSTDVAEFTSATGSKYEAPCVTIPAGGYGMSWKYQFYGVGAIAAIEKFAIKDAQLTIKQYDVHPLNDYDATQAATNLNNAEALVEKADIANNASLETYAKNARAYYNNLTGITKEKVFDAARLTAVEAATAKLIDAEIVALLADETAADFTTKLGKLYTRLDSLSEEIVSQLTKKADFDARYAYYAAIDLTITYDYNGGYAQGWVAYDQKDVIIPQFLKDLYDHMVEKGAFQKKVESDALVDDATLATPTFEEFSSNKYWADNYKQYANTVLTFYLFTAYTANDGTVNENYRDVIEGSDKFFNTEKGQKWLPLMDWVNEATQYANGAGQDAWGYNGLPYAAYTLFEKQPYFVQGTMGKDPSTVTSTTKGELLGAYRFAQYICGSDINSHFRNYVPHNVWSSVYDRQTTQETYGKQIYHCTDGTVTLMGTPYKAGYEFLGWVFEDGSEAKVTGAMFKDVTVYASWAPVLEAEIEKVVGKDVTGNYYGLGGDKHDFRGTTDKGDIASQVASVGLGERAIIVGDQLFIMPKYALIKLGANATAAATLTKDDLRPYARDQYDNNSTGLVYNADADTITGQNSYGHGALYYNAGQFDLTITLEECYGRILGGAAYGYEKFAFVPEGDAYKAVLVGGANGTYVLAPGAYLWCPMTADRFCSGLTNCDGTSGVVGVLSDGAAIEIVDTSAMVPAEKAWYEVKFVDGETELAAFYKDAGESFVKPADLKKAGYTFKGWATAADSTEVVEVATAPTASVTYYAVWESLPAVAATTVDPAYTGDDLYTFANIVDAFYATADGGTITVKAGTYKGDLVIDRPVSIIGPNADKAGNAEDRAAEAVIEGKIQVLANNVTIKGIKQTGGTTGDSVAPIAVGLVENVTIANNYLAGLYGVTDTVVYGNNRRPMIAQLAGGKTTNVIIEGNVFDFQTMGAYLRMATAWNLVDGLSFVNNTVKGDPTTLFYLYDSAGTIKVVGVAEGLTYTVKGSGTVVTE